jgi:hypothetical protein
MINFANNLDSLIKQNACWKGYEQVGMKMLDGREVPNCVPASKDIPNSKPKKKKKTEKNANQENETNVSDYIVDVPIKCTPGLGCKRLLTDNEKDQIAEAKTNIFPNLFPQEGDRISSMISSPEWAGIGTGLLGAAGLGGTVGLGAHLTNKNPLLYGALAAALGGLGAGLYGYSKKRRKNKDLAKLIEDLPVGADIGDIDVYSDPKMRAALARDFQRQVMRKGLT